LIARGLRRLSDGADVSIGGSSWDTARGALAAGDSIDIVGASGDLDFNPDTEETEAGIEVVTLRECGSGWAFIAVEPGQTKVECP
jgi:branched-chain amino acid transport system substrate-binding protein